MKTELKIFHDWMPETFELGTNINDCLKELVETIKQLQARVEKLEKNI